MIDLEAFRQAERATSAAIKDVYNDPASTPREKNLADIAQWMLVQIDSLTKQVAELEKK